MIPKSNEITPETRVRGADVLPLAALSASVPMTEPKVRRLSISC